MEAAVPATAQSGREMVELQQHVSKSYLQLCIKFKLAVESEIYAIGILGKSGNRSDPK